jgi:hypothetical protein
MSKLRDLLDVLVGKDRLEDIIEDEIIQDRRLRQAMLRLQYIIITGNIVDGMGFVGPFPNHEAAVAYAERECTEWVVAELEPKVECQAHEYEQKVGSIICVKCEEEF